VTYPIVGLHHVTATVNDAQEDLDFCIEQLGMRLVKKTVNFDNHFVYHFYYGDEVGTPGTIWTTFPYKDRGVRVGKKGAGQITETSFSVPAAAIEFWRTRLAAAGIEVHAPAARFGEQVLAFDDPSGLRIELIGSPHDPRAPWDQSGVEASAAVRGLHSVTMRVRSAASTIELMTGVLSFRVVDRTPGRTRLALEAEAPGHFIDVVEAPDADAALNGLGTVHHVAMAIADADAQVQLRADLLERGVDVTELRDRCYFRSIYFREPGGVLFEVATMAPGFTVDEDVASLGQLLKLPPWEEPNRPAIEGELALVTHR
jgi:glyoxalase family protein